MVSIALRKFLLFFLCLTGATLLGTGVADACPYFQIIEACSRMETETICCPGKPNVVNRKIIISVKTKHNAPGDDNIWVYFEDPNVVTGAMGFKLNFINYGNPTGGCGYYASYSLVIPEYNYQSYNPCDVSVPVNPAFAYARSFITDNQGYCQSHYPLYYTHDQSILPNNPFPQNPNFKKATVNCCWDLDINERFRDITGCTEIGRDGYQYVKLTIPASVANQYDMVVNPACSTNNGSNGYLFLYYYVNGMNTTLGIEPDCRSLLSSGDWEYIYKLPVVINSTSVQYFVHWLDSLSPTDGIPQDIIKTACACRCVEADFRIQGNTAAPLAVSFTPYYNNPAYTYTWNFGDGVTATGPYGFSHVYSAYGNYTACLSVRNDFTQCRACLPICLSQPSRSGGISYSQENGPGNECNLDFTYSYNTADNSLTLQANNPNLGGTYTWELGNGSTYTGTGISILNAPLSPLDVCLKVGNCKTCIRLCLPGKGKEGGGKLREAMTSGEEFQVFPNPASTEVSVVLNVAAGSKARYILTDITGRQLISLEKELGAGINTTVLDIASYPVGVYMLEVSYGNVRKTVKLVKE